MGQSPPSSSYSENGDGLPFIQGNAEFGPRYPAPRLRCSIPMRVAETGDLLLSVRAPVGEINQATQTTVIGRGLSALRFDNCEQSFAWHALTFAADNLNRFAQGSTFVAVNRDDVGRLMIPWHNESNSRIAAVLDKVEEAIAQTEKLIAKQRQVRAGLLHDLLTRGLDENGELRDPIVHPELFDDSPLGRIPKEWNSVRIKEEADIQHGYPFDGRYFTDKPVGPRLLVPGNFHRDGGLYFTEENTKYYSSTYPAETVLRNGDMLIVMTDLSPMTLILGRTVLLNEPFPALHNQRIGKFLLKRPDEWNVAFFVTMMNDDRLRRKVIREATGTTVRHTSPDRIRSGFALKPKLDEQIEIVARIGQINAAVVAATKEFTKLRCLKSGLTNDLLTGRVRVPESIGASA